MAGYNPLLAALAMGGQADINQEIGGALRQSRGGLMTNGQMAGLSPQAQGQVTHTAGGQFGGLPEVPEMTPLDEQQALSAAMENHDFGGAVARQDASGRAYFADPTPQAPMPDATDAEAGLAAKGYLKTPMGWKPSAGRAEQVRNTPGAIVADQPEPAMGGDGGVGVPTFSTNGLLPQAQRQALVTRNAQSRGMERDLRMGNQSPESILLSQLQGGGGGMDNPMMAGMAFGPQAYAAQLQAQQIPAQYAQQMAIMQAQANAAMEQQKAQQEFGTSPAGVLGSLAHAGADPAFAQGYLDLLPGAQGGGAGGSSAMDLKRLAMSSPNQQAYFDAIKRVLPGVTQQEADLAWSRAGKQIDTAGGWFTGPPVFNQAPPERRPDAMRIPGGNPPMAGFHGAPMGR